MQLLNERVRQVNFTIGILKEQHREITEKLSNTTLVPEWLSMQM